jgi:hypothetical protein
VNLDIAVLDEPRADTIESSGSFQALSGILDFHSDMAVICCGAPNYPAAFAAFPILA